MTHRSGNTHGMDALDIPRLRGVTHAYAFWLALVAAVVADRVDARRRRAAAAAIYGLGLCALFGGSALYHRWRWHPRWRPILRRVDHSTIYLFIAASYTPVGVLVLSGDGAVGGARHRLVRRGRAASRFSVAWINAPRCAVRGLLHRAGLGGGGRRPQLAAELPLIALVLIALGGVLYTVGAVVFALGRPDPWPRVFGFHEIFHVFVILAAVVHFVAMAGWTSCRPACAVSCADGRPHRTVEVKLLHPDARPPERTRAGDAAYDLRCVEAFTLLAGGAGDGRDRRGHRAAGRAWRASCCHAPAWRTGTASRA